MENTGKHPEEIVSDDPQPIAIALGEVLECAESIGRHKNLEATDGTFICWACADLQKRLVDVWPSQASLPSLHCEICLQAAKRRSTGQYVWKAINGIRYEFPTESDKDRQWRLMLRNMRHEPRLDREGASRLLANAKALPGAFEGSVRELTDAFHKRFGADTTVKPAYAGRYRDQ